MSNIRVCVRLRPLPTSSTAPPRLHYSISESKTSLAITKGAGSKEFIFDYVFDEETSNAFLYDSAISDIIDGCFSGYNSTIFAYGQSGSGKTYTMGTTTTLLNTESEGVIPRALKHIYSVIENDTINSYRIFASFIEIYNDDFIDLLVAGTESKDIVIREDNDNNITVSGMQESYLFSIDDAYALLERGNSRRRTAETLLNDVSSRSHAIFTLNIEVFRPRSTEQKGHSDGTFIFSKLHLVDLAGSERTKKSGAAGLRLKESVGINQGLMSLGRVIRALISSKGSSGHVPYRESKLTRFLQDSLGGNSKTLMIACVSSAEENRSETLSTLEYASKARLIHNKVVANVVQRRPSTEGSAVLVDTLRAQVETMRAEMSAKMPTESVLLKDFCVDVSPLVLHLSSILSGDNRPSLRELAESASALVARVETLLVAAEMEDEYVSELVRVREELFECKSDLARDEELYAAKVMELKACKSQLKQLETKARVDEERTEQRKAAEQAAQRAEVQELMRSKDQAGRRRHELEAKYYSLLEAADQAENDHKQMVHVLSGRLGELRGAMQQKQEILSNLHIISQNAQQLFEKYDLRMQELETEVKVTRETLSTVTSAAEREKLLWKLERSEDELEILKIRYEQQRKGFDMAKLAKNASSSDEVEAELRELREEDKRVRGHLEQENEEFEACGLERSHELELIEEQLQGCIHEGADIQRRLAKYSEQEVVAAVSAGTATLYSRYQRLLVERGGKYRSVLAQYLRLLDEVASRGREPVGGVESLQEEFESKNRLKEQLCDEIAELYEGDAPLQSSSSMRRMKELQEELQGVETELDLLKLRIIESSRRSSPRSRGKDEPSRPRDAESLLKEVDSLDKGSLREVVRLLSDIVLAEGSSKEASTELRHFQLENKALRDQIVALEREHTIALKAQATESEHKVNYLVQQLRQAEEANQRPASTPQSPGMLGSPFKRRSSPSKLLNTSVSSSVAEVDIAKVVSKWTAETRRRHQLEKRNSELMREIRLLRGKSSVGADSLEMRDEATGGEETDVHRYV